jgi:peptidoglycan/LPS O-acetylase OafA/YrhL
MHRADLTRLLNYPHRVHLIRLCPGLIRQTVLIKLQLMLTTLRPLAQAALSLGIAIASAWLICRLIERPCAQLRRQLK